MSRIYRSLCLAHAMDALRQGLSHFSGTSRVALLMSLKRGDHLRVYDPQNLLRDHEPRLRETMLDHIDWMLTGPPMRGISPHEQHPLPDPQLTGLIAHACRTRHTWLQVWFTEEHPGMCSTGPTRCWLEYAANQLSLDIGTVGSLRAGVSAFLLQGYALHAVRDWIVDQRNRAMGPDTKLRVYPTLDAVLGISHTREEGAWPEGRLAFIEPAWCERLDYLARFPAHERPLLANLRHCRKMLQSVTGSDRILVSDGVSITGITREKLPPCTIVADYRGRHGFLWLDAELVCSFSDGSFHSSDRRPNLVHLEEFLFEARCTAEEQQKLRRVALRIVECAQDRKHGCALIIDLGTPPRTLAGQSLVTPVDLDTDEGLSLACALAKVDGALHIRRDGALHGFACLMDGLSVAGENRARGARFNSALRFTANKDDLMVIVVSADRPVSVIQRGVELTSACAWLPLSTFATPPLLEHWIQGP